MEMDILSQYHLVLEHLDVSIKINKSYLAKIVLQKKDKQLYKVKKIK